MKHVQLYFSVVVDCVGWSTGVAIPQHSTETSSFRQERVALETVKKDYIETSRRTQNDLKSVTIHGLFDTLKSSRDNNH